MSEQQARKGIRRDGEGLGTGAVVSSGMDCAGSRGAGSAEGGREPQEEGTIA